MINRFILQVGFRNFAQSRHSRLVSFISVMAISGLVLGIALLVAVLSVMNGFDREMKTRILGQIPHIRLFDPSGPLREWQPLQKQILAQPGIVAAEPYVLQQGLLTANGRVAPINLEGLFLNPQGRAGLLLGDSLPIDSNSIYLAEGVAAELQVTTGQKLTLMLPGESRPGSKTGNYQVHALTIGGIFRTGTALDHMLAVMDIHHAGEIAGLGQGVDGLQVTVTNILNVRQKGFELLRALPGKYSFNDWLQSHGHLYQAIKMSRNLVSLLVFLIIGLAVFNVISMLVMTVVDKKKAVAIYKTLGATKSEVLGIFILQGMMIGVTGVFLGEVLGIVISWNLDELVSCLEWLIGRQLLNTQVYPVDFLPVLLRWQDLLVIAGVTLMLNFLATLYPAWKAANTMPAQVLSED